MGCCGSTGGHKSHPPEEEEEAKERKRERLGEERPTAPLVMMAVAPTVPDLQKRPARVRICGRCGRAMVTASKFCSLCGTSFSHSSRTKERSHVEPSHQAPKASSTILPSPAGTPGDGGTTPTTKTVSYGGYEVVDVQWN